MQLDAKALGVEIGVLISDTVAPLIKRLEMLEGQEPKQGEKGEPGPAGRDADPLDPDHVADLVVQKLLATDRIATLVELSVAASVEKYFEDNPIQHGSDGKDGARGPQGERGEKGADGAAGCGVVSLLIDRAGELVATMSDGQVKNLGVVVGRDGERGADGRDGADFSGYEMEWDGDRTLVIRGRGAEIRHKFPIPMDAGYWVDGSTHEKGHIVTNEGNAWIALRDTKAVPRHDNKEDWRLLARKGRDGRDGKDGKPVSDHVKLKVDAHA